ncbi:MAG: quinone-interacting membrane-bound oxidoreductase complex subunit QmoC [Desulfopila sp.]|jgi:quinone-modifying oxidoreductase subunit QmoC|nr:quinone-interacting membrane-bound oxidoreductase complex subunit QmoC [Desulfopila sp.]
MNVQPDVEFIKYLKGVGGDTVKKCYQCATCSVVCPLSGDQKPFPRKEMIWSQWGMKENLLADPDVFLCHQCGDCTENCPRGAKPAEVLGAIRAYAYNYYAWPRGLATLASSIKGLPMLIGIPAVIIFVMWFLSGGLMDNWSANFEAGYGYQRMFGYWDFHWYAKNIFFIVAFMVPAAGLAVFSAYKGITNLWKAMSAQYDLNREYRPSVVQFVQQFLWPSIVEMLTHKRFEECTVNTERAKGHKPLVFAFIGLFIVTCWSLFANDILGLFWPQFHGPMTFWNPVKLLANVSAIALLYGMWVLWTSRSENEKKAGIEGNFYDWFLIWEIVAVGITGLLAEVCRWAGLATVGHIIYYLHLVSVMMLFLYMPYTKFAHIVYRTFAMSFEKYRESAFAKGTVE